MSEINAHIDYYAILGVPFDVTPDDVRRAYRDLARIYHPDAVSGDAEKFRQIQQAYDVLSDPVYRRTYNRQRESRGYARSAESPISINVFQNRDQLPILDSEQILYVILEMRSDELNKHSRQRLNITLGIDRSTSMRGSRMPHVKMAATDL